MEPTTPSQSETDAKLETIAERFVEALSDAMRQMQREWHPIPFLPLLIGVNRTAKGAVRSWALRFTWMRNDTTYTLPISSDTDDPVGMTVEPIHQARQIVPFVPLFVGTKRYHGRTTQKRWWAWEIECMWIREH